jgi:hypothetical protein
MEAVDVLCLGFWLRTKKSFDVQMLDDAEGFMHNEFAQDDHYIGS